MAKSINSILNLKDNYSKTINQATSYTTKFNNTVKSITGTFSELKGKTTDAFSGIAKSAIGITAGYIGIKSTFSYIKEGMEMAKNSQLATAQLEAVLASTGNTIGMTKDQLLDLAGSYGTYTTYTKGAVLSGENLLLTFTGIGKDVLPDTISAMLDMSTALKQDVTTSAMTLGKALNNPLDGLTKLTRQGVNFTEEQKNQIKAMVQAGDVAGAQKVMLAELNKEFGGSAKAAGETIPGKLQILQNTFNGLKKYIGEKFIPVLYDIVLFATDKLPTIKAVFTNVFDNIGKIVNGAVDIFKNNLLPVFQNIWENAEPYINNIRDLLPSAFEKVKEVASEVFENVKKFIDDNKDSVGNFIGAFMDLVKTISDSLTPVITTLFTQVLPSLQDAFSGNNGVIKDILDNATNVFNFINNNWNEIEPIILTITGALSAYKLALIAIEINTVLVSVLTGAWSFITGIIETITTATSIWAGVQEILNGVLMDNPIGFVIGIIALLGLAIYEVIKHWESIYNWIQWVWGVLEDNPILLFISAVLNPFGTAILAIVANWDKVKNSVEWAWNKIKDFWAWWNGTSFDDKNINVNANTQTVTDGSAVTVTSNTPNVGANATGTSFWKGGWTKKDEFGGEMAYLPGGSAIIPADKTDKILNENSNGISVSLIVQGNVIGNEDFKNDIGQHIYDQVKLAMLNS